MGKYILPKDLFGSDYDKFFVGFDNAWNNLAKLHDDVTKNIPGYPPYNIRKVEENKYVVELAVAGFARQDIEITLDENKLVVTGQTKDDSENNFLYKGIANRAFTRTFALDDHIEVENAELVNGMLKVFLERIIPEHKKPKKIEVKDTGTKSSKQLLNEEDK